MSDLSMGAGATEGGWIRQIEGLIEGGQCFLAYDRADQARQAYPDSRRLQLLSILALMRSGGITEARKLLAALPGVQEPAEPIATRILDLLREHLPAVLRNEPARDGPAVTPPGTGLSWIEDLARQLRSLGQQTPGGTPCDPETLELRARIHAELWRQQGNPQDLRQGRDSYLRAFRSHHRCSSGVHAARLTWLLGEPARATEIAREVQATAGDKTGKSGQPGGALGHAEGGKERFFTLADGAECALLTGDRELAEARYRQALAGDRVHYGWVLEVRHRLLALQDAGLNVPPSLLELHRPPVILIGGGHPLDPPGALHPVFPAACEAAVRLAIQEHLDRLAPQIGYSSAAAGSELLFVETMLERDAEVHLVLPFSTEDFIRERVAPAGPRWERRFRHALKLVASVTHATEEPYLGHDWLFRFNNQIIDGMARLRADLLGTAPYLLLVWDYAAELGAGTAADLMDHWPDVGRLRLIDLDAVRCSQLRESVSPAPIPVAPPLPGVDTAAMPSPNCLRREPQRVLKTLLFADLVGFSKLREEELPGFWDYLAQIQRRLGQISAPPDLVESWGDALYVVMSSARALLRHAFVLQDSFSRLDPRLHGLPEHLSLRIGLHAGPVYTGQHPLTGRPIVYGSHVSRTARIEPIALPGKVYASQQFVALLTSEETANAATLGPRGQTASPWYACEYLGYQPLAKNYGKMPVYHLLP
ncbi:MAG: adenylate/guanylate cyclase domain-containing protein [Chromatiaceae bacterium]|nr:adenylate/guanylate cyclase domain-containing protein [Candidatus Thioaporhodococcus sediminis]